MFVHYCGWGQWVKCLLYKPDGLSSGPQNIPVCPNWEMGGRVRRLTGSSQSADAYSSKTAERQGLRYNGRWGLCTGDHLLTSVYTLLLICPHLNTYETQGQKDRQSPPPALWFSIGQHYRTHGMCVKGFAIPSKGRERSLLGFPHYLSDGVRLIKAFLLLLRLRLRKSPLTPVRQLGIGNIEQKVCISAAGWGMTLFHIGWLYE